MENYYGKAETTGQAEIICSYELAATCSTMQIIFYARYLFLVPNHLSNVPSLELSANFSRGLATDQFPVYKFTLSAVVSFIWSSLSQLSE